MSVDRASARQVASHEGRRFYFCSAGCQAKFEAAPAQYLEEQPAAASPPAGTKYTCPLHPAIVQDGPGDCPLCGMALEPMRSEARRLGNGWVSTCRSRGAT